MEIVTVPQERVAVLIGVRGEAKKRIERRTGARLHVDEEGRVEISSKDAFGEYLARDMVKAVGRGFSPDDALKLAEDDYYLKIVDLKDELGSDKAVARQKARIIGEGGKARRMLEECSDAKVSVYGGTVAFIGLLDEVELASVAVEKLLDGKSHAFVYRLLEHGRRRMKEERIAHMWGTPARQPGAEG